jgi:alpha-ribazole phosphatase/probable phosphoglycerate mutase
MASIIWPHPSPPQEVIPDLVEIDFGDWETLTVEEVEARFPEAYSTWTLSRKSFLYPGGESVPDFCSRVDAAAREQFTESSGITLAVLHKGVIKEILASLLGCSSESLRDQSVELGSLFRLQQTEKRWQLISGNEIEHLQSDRSPEAILPRKRKHRTAREEKA